MNGMIRSPKGIALAAGIIAVLALAGMMLLRRNATPTEELAPMVTIETSKGNIVVELFSDKAPLSVKNFLQYVDGGHYDGTIFHRVINGFMIQGGGFTKDMQQKPAKAPVRNEAENGLKNLRGTLALARTPDVNSATCQFFINVVDNSFLDFTSPTPQGYGYCVFGKVVQGMEVVDQIKAVPTGRAGPFSDVPTQPVEILRISQVK